MGQCNIDFFVAKVKNRHHFVKKEAFLSFFEYMKLVMVSIRKF